MNSYLGEKKHIKTKKKVYYAVKNGHTFKDLHEQAYTFLVASQGLFKPAAIVKFNSSLENTDC